MSQAPLWLMHCDAHLDAQGDQIPCPGHYLRGHVNMREKAVEDVRRVSVPGGHAVVTNWVKVDG